MCLENRDIYNLCNGGKHGFRQKEKSNMSTLPSNFREGFTEIYTGNPPWDIGRPQAPFIAVAEQIKAPVLDAGCGTGNTSIFLAGRGLEVTGIDFVEEAIRQAREKAAQRGLQIDFEVKDAMTLLAWDKHFASVIDSGLYHIYEVGNRQAYVQGLAHVLQPGGRLFLLSFTDDEPSAQGGVSKDDLYIDFADGWQIESIEEVRGEINPAFITEHPEAFPEGGPKMWFAIVRKL